MQNKNLHIISFDNPFPPNYGGVIDVFYKIKALHSLGFTIYLHCFHDERNSVSDDLKTITQEVFLYKKNRNPFFFLSGIPFAVASRFQKKMIKNIESIDAPIFFDGLQTTMLIQKTNLKNKKYLRLHNLESNFFAGMTNSETNWLKKALYYFEGKKYQEYQKKIVQFDHVFPLSRFENELVKSITKATTYIPVFHGNENLKPLSEFGNYAFYHGDLRLPDNKKVAQFLIEIFKKIPNYKFLIASSAGKDFIENKIKFSSNIEFVTIENEAHLDRLLENAHINVMLSFQQSGTKLKVVNSLFKSRHCLINRNMIDDERILQLCEIATTKEEFVLKIQELTGKAFSDFNRREEVLFEVFDNLKNAQKMLKLF
jgi:hypothetical protein